jgi:hypothetical protein
MDTELEDLIKDCVAVKDDRSKSAKSRRIARTTIEICHGVIDLKAENERLYRQIEELRAKLKAKEDPPEAV